MNHSELCELAVKWLRTRKQNNCIRYARTCNVVASEVKFSGMEIPDAIGFHGGDSILIECKVTASDFRRDSRKLNRKHFSMGDFRIYLTPTGLIDPDNVRDSWGLLETDGKKITLVKEPLFLGGDKSAEQRLLLSMIRSPNRKGIWLK